MAECKAVADSFSRRKSERVHDITERYQSSKDEIRYQIYYQENLQHFLTVFFFAERGSELISLNNLLGWRVFFRCTCPAKRNLLTFIDRGE